MVNFNHFFCCCLLCSLIVVPQKKLLAQDANYWRSSVGPAGLLTPGAMIVNDQDSGLYYYNPALTALHPKNSVSISANLYQLSLYNVRDGVGTGKNLKTTSVQIIPLIVSGNLFLKGKKTIVFGYSLVHDPVTTYQVTQRQDKKMNVLDDSYSPGDEYFVGQYVAHNKVSNTVASGSIAVKLNAKWAIGLTAEAQLRSQDYFEQYSSRALINTLDTLNQLFPMTNVESSYQINYWNVGLRFKFGVSYENGPHHLGALLSSPRLNVKGNATITNDLVINDLHIVPGTAINFNLLANGRQTGLPVKYKDPLSIALGYGLDYGRGEIFVTGEYFMKVRRYSIVNPKNGSFVRPDTGTNISMTNELLQFNEQRKSIVNFGIGIKHEFTPVLAGYASFRTDFNYDDNQVTINSEFNGHHPNIATWNTYHSQLGVNVRRRKGNLHAGLLLSYGSTNDFIQPVNFDTPNENNQMQGDLRTTTARYFSTGVLLAYILNL